ncbi:hypothetical protein KUTeg_023176 [Tegillarca granosa]|uniref:EGF-like domain-containing protein n=1 Tax=Tegillarca granosa TaxID=220873 RepID=A0ABQ9E3Y7_TEGGR|nr:hypothetical protein KUTeg_023176 [Tegillarca granosa]
MLLSTRNDIRLVEVSPLGVSKTNTIIIDNFTGIAAVDFIYADSSVFWTDIELKTIKRAWLNGSEDIRNVISTDLESPDGLATDWLGKKLYWVDSEKKRIEVSELDGRSRLVLFWYNLDMPRAIALDPQRGYMFWSDVGETPKIERAGMDGSGRLVLIYRDIFWPNGLTIDYEDSRIYWIDARLNYIGSCNYEGNEIFSYRKKKRILHPSALTFFNRTWFWTDWMTRSVHSLTEWSNFEVVFKSVHEPMDIHVYCGERQSKGLHEIPCNLNNGGCSHLCLLSPMSPYFKCACPTGVKMRDDNKTCADDVEEFLLVSTRRSIRMISLHTPDYSQLILPLKDLVHVIAIDYDPVESRIYWTDSESNSISTSHLNGTGQNVVIGSEIKDPDGMAVDWIGRNLYWTDTGYDTIQVSRLNGSFRTVLIDTGLDEPRVIRVDPLSGLMFWTDWGKNPKIERANMDGSSRIVLVESSLGWPNGLSIDREEKNIYWADAKKDKLEVATFDGRRRRENLYWTDWQWRHVSRINKQTQISSIIAEQIPDIMGVKAVNIRENTGTNECAMDNFGCSHLCLVRQHSFPRCACPNGFELDSEGKICLEEKATLFLTNGNGFNKMNLGVNSRRLISVPKETKNVLVFDIHIGENRIYWIDAADKNILRSFINDTVVEHVVKNGLDYPEDIALDWLSSNVYWTDLGTRRIEVVRCDGSSRKVLLWKNLGYVTTLTVDPNTGQLYVLDELDKSRAALDGSGRKILLQNLQRAYGLTIDYSDGRLYWANSGRCIESSDIEVRIANSLDINISGNNRTCVVEEDIGHPTSITMYGDNLVWIDWQKQTIEQAEKRTGCNRTVLQTGMGTMMDVFAHYSQKQLGQNACQYNNGGCSHLCLPLPSGDQSNTTHKCACPTHYILNEDNISCSAPSSYLLFSQKIQINRLVLPTNATQDEISDTIITTLPIVGLKSIRALSYDPVDRNIYVIDRKTKSINRFNDSEIQLFNYLCLICKHHSFIMVIYFFLNQSFLNILFLICLLYKIFQN